MRSYPAALTSLFLLIGCTGTSDVSTEDIKNVAAPANLTATRIGATAVRLAWSDLSTNEDSFIVERLASGSDYTPTVFVPADVTTAVDSMGIRPDSTYSYRVRAIRYVNTSSYSNTVTVTFRLPFP